MGQVIWGRGSAEEEEEKEKIPHVCESIGYRPLRGRCPKGRNSINENPIGIIDGASETQGCTQTQELSFLLKEALTISGNLDNLYLLYHVNDSVFKSNFVGYERISVIGNLGRNPMKGELVHSPMDGFPLPLSP